MKPPLAASVAVAVEAAENDWSEKRCPLAGDRNVTVGGELVWALTTVQSVLRCLTCNTLTLLVIDEQWNWRMGFFQYVYNVGQIWEFNILKI